MSFPKAVTGKRNEVTVVSNLGGTGGESSIRTTGFPPSQCVSHLPTPTPQPSWPFYKALCLLTTNLSVCPNPSPPHSLSPVLTYVPSAS